MIQYKKMKQKLFGVKLHAVLIIFLYIDSWKSYKN